MSTTTPKRKRGQRAKRHTWSNAATNGQPFNDGDCARWDAFAAFGMSDDGCRAAKAKQPEAIYAYFNAGYRAGKDAK